MQPTPEEDEPDDEDGDVDDVSESDNDELDTDMIDERDSADDVSFYFTTYYKYCRTLFFRCILISRFSYVENSLHFNFADFPVGPILARMHWSYNA